MMQQILVAAIVIVAFVGQRVETHAGAAAAARAARARRLGGAPSGARRLARTLAQAAHRARRGRGLRRLRGERRRPSAPSAAVKLSPFIAPLARAMLRGGAAIVAADTAATVRDDARRTLSAWRPRRAASCRWRPGPPPCCTPPGAGTLPGRHHRAQHRARRGGEAASRRRRGNARFRTAAGPAADGGGGGGGRRAARAHRSHQGAGHPRLPGARDAPRAACPNRCAGWASSPARSRSPTPGRDELDAPISTLIGDALPRAHADPRALPDLGSAYLHDRRQARDHRCAARCAAPPTFSPTWTPPRPRSRAKPRCCAIRELILASAPPASARRLAGASGAGSRRWPRCATASSSAIRTSASTGWARRSSPPRRTCARSSTRRAARPKAANCDLRLYPDAGTGGILRTPLRTESFSLANGHMDSRIGRGRENSQ